MRYMPFHQNYEGSKIETMTWPNVHDPLFAGTPSNFQGGAKCVHAA